LKAYHYPCQMVAKEDSSGGGGVVDPQLKVFGVRVADSSVPVGDCGVFAGAGSVRC